MFLDHPLYPVVQILLRVILEMAFAEQFLKIPARILFVLWLHKIS